MKLPKSFTKVTPFSKTLALIIFTLFPIIGFFLGIYYQQSKQTENKNQEKIVRTYPSDTPNKLIERCGDIPITTYPKLNHFDVMNGPAWSPDCRNIAWSVWESGTGYAGNDPEILQGIEANARKLSEKEGVFIYSDANQTIEKIYNPLKLDETPTFIEWQDRENLVFTAGNIRYKYNLLTNEVSQL